MKIVIRAGGVGSRLWPVSRQAQPKQFHALTGDKTLLAEAIDRVRPIAAIDDIFISTNATAEQLVREQYSEVPAANIIVEPQRKDTAAAIGLESIIIRKRDPEAVVASLGSDHSVRKVEEFQRMLQIAEEFVNRHPEYIIPIGIRPTGPDVGYGYIQYNEILDTFEGKNLWKVDSFKEKPTLEVAKQFLSEGNYLWNANMFVWKVSTILALYETYLPEMYEQLLIIEEALGTDEEQEIIERVYPTLEKIAVDYAIIEKTPTIAAMAGDIGWSDIGDWARLKDELASSEQENVAVNTELIAHKTENSFVYSNTKGKTVVMIGVDNIVVVETDDVLLICDKYRSGDVKNIVQKLEEDHREELL